MTYIILWVAFVRAASDFIARNPICYFARALYGSRTIFILTFSGHFERPSDGDLRNDFCIRHGRKTIDRLAPHLWTKKKIIILSSARTEFDSGLRDFSRYFRLLAIDNFSKLKLRELFFENVKGVHFLTKLTTHNNTINTLL